MFHFQILIDNYLVQTESTTISIQKRQSRERANSLSSTITIAHDNERISRSLSSLNCILNR
ncbi:unnamed protein product, partial [Rotaria sp. Silwood2]